MSKDSGSGVLNANSSPFGFGTGNNTTGPALAGFNISGPMTNFGPAIPGATNNSMQSGVATSISTGQQIYDNTYAGCSPQVKSEIDRTYSEFKLPMETVLHEISRQSEPHHMHEVSSAQKELRLKSRFLKIKQERCMKQGKSLRETARTHLFASRRYGNGGMEQIHKREVYDVPLNEALPTDFYCELLRDFEARAQTHGGQVSAVEKDLSVLLQNHGRRRQDESAINRETVMRVIRNQQEAIERLGALVGRLHRDTEGVKQEYLTMRQVSGSVFDEEDRAEALQQRRKEQQLREAVMARAVSEQAKPSLPAQPSQVQFGMLQQTTFPSTPQASTFTTINPTTSSSSWGASPSMASGGTPSSGQAVSFGGFSGIASSGGLSNALNPLGITSGIGGESVVQTKVNKKKAGLGNRK
jgi:hypothetical protein